MKLSIGDFYKNLSRKSKYGQNRKKISETFREDPNVLNLVGSAIRNAK
jgi:hypothetical protein